MNVGVFIPGNNEEHARMLRAFAVGVSNVGTDVRIYDVNDYRPVDIAVVFGVGKKGVPVSYPRARVIEEQRAHGRKVIIIEKGFVRRDEYYMVGFNGLNNRADFRNNFTPSDRWKKLGVELREHEAEDNDSHKKIIVCGQVPSDASVQNVNIIEWCGDIIHHLRILTEREIIFRPHPLARDRTPRMIGAHNSTRSFDEDLADAWAVVTYNSNAAVEAVIAGVPAVSFDHGSMAWNVTKHTLDGAINPVFPSIFARRRWACSLAYAQWNEAEFEAGLPWLHLTGPEIQRKTARWR